MLISGAGDSYAYEVGAPGVDVLWGLWTTHRDVDGHETESAVTAVPDGPLGIETRIAHELASRDVVAVSGSMWSRSVRLRDGRTVDFAITLEVTDWRCLDCGQDMSEVDEYYFLRDDVWLSVVPGRAGHLCIGCLEVRLGRELVAGDFKERPTLDERMTDRLRERLNRTAGP
ncbi:hypothetical protein ACWDTD_10550 [Gordonia sp. NPDC003425]